MSLARAAYSLKLKGPLTVALATHFKLAARCRDACRGLDSAARSGLLSVFTTMLAAGNAIRACGTLWTRWVRLNANDVGCDRSSSGAGLRRLKDRLENELVDHAM